MTYNELYTYRNKGASRRLQIPARSKPEWMPLNYRRFNKCNSQTLPLPAEYKLSLY